MCVCVCHASFHTDGFALLPAFCAFIIVVTSERACAFVHETHVYFHTGMMNHLAENLSLISHLRFLFTLARAHSFSTTFTHTPFLTVLCSEQIAPQVSSTTRESFTMMAKQQPISSLYGLWNWLKTGPAAFWVGDAPLWQLFSSGGLSSESFWFFRSVTSDNGTGIHCTAKWRLPWRRRKK